MLCELSCVKFDHRISNSFPPLFLIYSLLASRGDKIIELSAVVSWLKVTVGGCTVVTVNLYTATTTWMVHVVAVFKVYWYNVPP